MYEKSGLESALGDQEHQITCQESAHKKYKNHSWGGSWGTRITKFGAMRRQNGTDAETNRFKRLKNALKTLWRLGKRFENGLEIIL